MKNYLIKGAVIVGAVILLVEGFFLYQLSQDRNVTTDAGDGRVAQQYTSQTGSPERSSAGQGATDSAGLAYIHRATPENTSENSTYLDNPRLNGNPDAVITVTQNWNPDSGNGVYNDHLIGVWYDPDAGQWAIFNQDRAAMPEGAAFNVSVPEAQ